METNNMMPFAFPQGGAPVDKSQNIIKVIGVGGGGSNAVKNMYKQGVHNVQFVQLILEPHRDRGHQPPVQLKILVLLSLPQK